MPDESDVSIQKITIIVKKVGMGVDSDIDYKKVDVCRLRIHTLVFANKADTLTQSR